MAACALVELEVVGNRSETSTPAGARRVCGASVDARQLSHLAPAQALPGRGRG